jgi:hypothetical protein
MNQKKLIKKKEEKAMIIKVRKMNGINKQMIKIKSNRKMNNN